MPNLILTKYHGPTNTKGSRISVHNLTTGKKIFVPFDYAAWCAHTSAVVVALKCTNAQKIAETRQGYYYLTEAAQ